MKTAKDFFEKLRTNEAFAKEVCAKLKEKYDAGEQDYKALWIPVAAEFGYEVTGEDLDELKAKAEQEMSEEELGKVAGGTSPLCAGLIVISITQSAAWTIMITNSTKLD